jgi:hypothetical protein
MLSDQVWQSAPVKQLGLTFLKRARVVAVTNNKFMQQFSMYFAALHSKVSRRLQMVLLKQQRATDKGDSFMSASAAYISFYGDIKITYLLINTCVRIHVLLRS